MVERGVTSTTTFHGRTFVFLAVLIAVAVIPLTIYAQCCSISPCYATNLQLLTALASNGPPALGATTWSWTGNMVIQFACNGNACSVSSCHYCLATYLTEDHVGSVAAQGPVQSNTYFCGTVNKDKLTNISSGLVYTFKQGNVVTVPVYTITIKVGLTNTPGAPCYGTGGTNYSVTSAVTLTTPFSPCCGDCSCACIFSCANTCTDISPDCCCP